MRRMAAKRMIFNRAADESEKSFSFIREARFEPNSRHSSCAPIWGTVRGFGACETSFRFRQPQISPFGNFGNNKLGELHLSAVELS